MHLSMYREMLEGAKRHGNTRYRGSWTGTRSEGWSSSRLCLPTGCEPLEGTDSFIVLPSVGAIECLNRGSGLLRHRHKNSVHIPGLGPLCFYSTWWALCYGECITDGRLLFCVLSPWLKRRSELLSSSYIIINKPKVHVR